MKFIYTFISTAAVGLLLYSCLESDLEKGKRLAKTYCGSCHLFPEPSLLDKKTWQNGIMPKMAFRMGLDNFGLLEIPKPDQKAAASTIPKSAMTTQKEWQLIQDYYQANAPDSLMNSAITLDSLTQFSPHALKVGNSNLMVTVIQSNKNDNSLWIGTRLSKLYKFSFDFAPLDTIELTSPPSNLLFQNDQYPLILQMGIMDPNDQPAGSLIRLDGISSPTKIIDSLKRPVFIEPADLNNDKQPDYVICAFGNFTGSLLCYEQRNGSFIKHIISNVPGSRKVVVQDFDGDGDQDIMALLTQGDEKIQLFLNNGDFTFESKIILRFPPVYGSNYFELADFNADGLKDIIYCNGDNADYSFIVKPYHGIRIFLNKGQFQYEESFFYPMPGASQTSVNDFDGDGDLDIAVIAFFPNFKKGQNGFVYLENTNNLNYKPYTTALASDARWLRMEAVDLDKDNDMDLVLGALNFPIGATLTIRNYWDRKNVSLLILRNQKK